MGEIATALKELGFSGPFGRQVVITGGEGGGRWLGGVDRQLRAILASGSRKERLHQVKAPTLVIHGTVDPLVRPEGGKDTAASIPGARMAPLEGRNLFTDNAPLVEALASDSVTIRVLVKTAPLEQWAVARTLRQQIKARFDYERYGGAPLLGVKGVSIVTHGRAKARMVENAIRVASESAHVGVPTLIAEWTREHPALAHRGVRSRIAARLHRERS